MDWEDRHSGISGNTINVVFLVALLGVWGLIRLIFFDWHPATATIVEVFLGIFAFWWVGEWGERAETDKRKMHEAIDIIERKLAAIESTVIPHSGRIEHDFEILFEHLGCSRFVEEDWMSITRDSVVNSPSAFALSKRRAEQGFPMAQFRVGLHYAFGVQVKKDLAQAVHFYRQAARQGHACAQLHLGMAYANGDGISEDIQEAFFWMFLSAESCKEAQEWRDRFGMRLPSDKRIELENRCRFSPYAPRKSEEWDESDEGDN